MENDLKYVEGRVGEKFGRWTIIQDLGTIRDKWAFKSAVIVKCECGNVKQIFYSLLRYGVSRSCGCYRKEWAANSIKNREHKHNLSKHPLYQIWRGMKCRCLNKQDKAYKDYGGRGITICDEWVNDFKSFYDWAINNGWEKGLINDRRDNNKGYGPDNCRFVDDPTSLRNTRRTVIIEYNGVKKCRTDWAKEIGIEPNSLKKRIKKWGIEKALTTPPQN